MYAVYPIYAKACTRVGQMGKTFGESGKPRTGIHGREQS
jgi:hypothetical protein